MQNPSFSISTWSLHGLISAGLPLVDVPREVAKHGIDNLEICHFHFPNTEPGYLTNIKQAADDAGITIRTVLIDTGDIASPDDSVRDEDIQTIKDWIQVAASLHAYSVRVCAGKQPPSHDAILRSAAALTELYHFGQQLGVKVITENWLETGLAPLVLLQILDRCDRNVGLCADTGNAEGPDKYDTLRLLLPKATAIHCKARYTERHQIDLLDLDICLELIESSEFDGPITLIYGDTVDEWHGVDTLKGAIVSQFAYAV
jgi:sugar phosphate isomerase/epimerase